MKALLLPAALVLGACSKPPEPVLPPLTKEEVDGARVFRAAARRFSR